MRAHRTRMSGMWGNATNGDPGTPGRSDSPAPTELMDWTAARREAADIEALGDHDLDKLFDDIVRRFWSSLTPGQSPHPTWAARQPTRFNS